MRQVSLREANQNFSSYVAEVEAGERLILLRRGKPVAQMLPYTEDELDQRREKARKQLLAIMDAGMDLGGKPWTYDERHER